MLICLCANKIIIIIISIIITYVVFCIHVSSLLCCFVASVNQV